MQGLLRKVIISIIFHTVDIITMYYHVYNETILHSFLCESVSH